MRPTLLQYLNNQIPPLVPIKPSISSAQENKTQKVPSVESTLSNNSNTVLVHSVIDDNIKKEKSKNRKKVKAKPKGKILYKNMKLNYW